MTEPQCHWYGCPNDGMACTYPDGSLTFYCDEHRYRAGFCISCGTFWAGIESFHFWEPIGFCDECRQEFDEPDYTDPEYDAWEEAWEEDHP